HVGGRQLAPLAWRRILRPAARYLSALPTSPNTVLTRVPTKLTALMMTIAMRLAIRAYSIAVAPASSRRNIRMDFMLVPLLLKKSACSALPPCLPTPDPACLAVTRALHCTRAHDQDKMLMSS